jgi:hypothetical protein
MKAVEYFNQYQIDRNKKGEQEALGQVVIDMLAEVKTIGEKRGVQLLSGLASIFAEQDQKWRAFVRLCEKNGYHNIRPDGFAQFCTHKIPSTIPFFKLVNDQLVAKR